jgi:hypothetical protein
VVSPCPATLEPPSGVNPSLNLVLRVPVAAVRVSIRVSTVRPRAGLSGVSLCPTLEAPSGVNLSPNGPPSGRALSPAHASTNHGSHDSFQFNPAGHAPMHGDTTTLTTSARPYIVLPGGGPSK